MKEFRRYYTFIILLSVILFSSNKMHSQTAESVRAMWIFNIAPGVTWENNANVSKYTIGVFSSSKEFEELKKQAKTKMINGKPVEVIQYVSYADVAPNHIVYVTKNENSNLGFIYQKLQGKNVLIISDRSKQPQYSVINFNKTSDSKQPFTINTSLYKKQRLVFALSLLRLGGDRAELKRIQAETNRKLLAEKKELEKKKLEIAEKERRLIEQGDEIQNQRDSIASKENMLSAKEDEVRLQNLRLDSMSFEIIQKQEDLLKNKIVLSAQEENLKTQRMAALLLQDSMTMAGEELKIQQEKIRINKEKLGVEQKASKQKSGIINWFIAGSVLAAFFFVVIIISFINKQKVNRELSTQYEAINSQKNEIQSQAQLLESTNEELEKLSLVASGTDNAVTIMDINGNFEWINAGFTRMYGYTLQLLRNELADNIITASNNDEVKGIIENIIETKQTGSYQNLNKTRRGEDIWAQTTITPILDDSNEVTKLISIDTNITEEKKAEIEIHKQKDFIEIQNEQITASINYAKNIQQAILPLNEDINKFFQSFVIFKPKQVVSGDFYWFVHLPARDGFSEKVFFAAVDCTGHGVPGAFMSMIGSRLLSEIVLEQKIISPKDILETLDQKVKIALRQETTDNNDGMDMSVCVMEKEDNNYHFTYSGAKSDLYYYSQGNDDITIVSSERRSIGGTKQKRGNIKFTNKDFYLKDGDYIWLSTDGIIDQNNSERKRFGTPRFIELVKSAKDLNLSEQKELFELELAEHQGDEEQRDDITVWGIKLSDQL